MTASGAVTDNPFGVYSPEQLTAEYIAKNFVDLFTDLPRLKDRGNLFIHGARGTGKSMLLRSLEPEVMLRSKKISRLEDIPHLAVHVPLKKAEFAVPELTRLAGGYASIAIGEHLLVMQVMFRLAGALQSLAGSIELAGATSFHKQFSRLFSISGGGIEPADTRESEEAAAIFGEVGKICEREIMGVRGYFARLAFPEGDRQYRGALTGFLDFLVPLAKAVGSLKPLPDVPIFVMLDDADNLPVDMQRIVNSWVSTRSTHAVCLKITTQLGYATMRTVDNRIIESPHDFAEVNLSTVYTTDHETYSNRIREIVIRRLQLAGIESDVDNYFPFDEKQATRLRQIEEEIETERSTATSVGTRRGSTRARDERIRYAVPRLMRELSGSSRSSHTYSYAGFKSLVDLSSGIVRWFLEPASRMYDLVVSETNTPPKQIPVGIQDNVVLDWSKEFVQRLSSREADSKEEVGGELTWNTETSLHAYGHETELYDRLRNLVEALGRIFRQKLLDESASEQRVFSIVLRDKASRELSEVLDLGIRLGYLHKSDNASKEALGSRLPRYILARRLGPYYRLDVSGYSAHLSVTAADLEIALKDPAEFVKIRLRQGGLDDRQYALDLERDADDPEAFN